MSNDEMLVDTGNWEEFPGEEQDKINIVLEKIATKKPREAVEIERLDPVAIPELAFQIREKFGEKYAMCVSNFNGCDCGECDVDGVYYAMALADTAEDASAIMAERAKQEGGILAEELMDENGELDIGKAIAMTIARGLSNKFGGKVNIRQMSLEEVMELGIDLPEGGMIMTSDGHPTKKRTVH